jgi:hypothetical protein
MYATHLQMLLCENNYFGDRTIMLSSVVIVLLIVSPVRMYTGYYGLVVVPPRPSTCIVLPIQVANVDRFF